MGDFQVAAGGGVWVAAGVRNLPLNAVTMIHIPRRKKEAQRPSEVILHVKDGSATFEAKNLR